MAHKKRLISFSKTILATIINAITLLFLSSFLDSVKFESILTAIVTSITIGIANSLLWPLFSRLTLPLTVMTFGLGSLILNVLFINLVSLILPGFEILSFWDAIILTLVLTGVNTAVNELISIDDDQAYYRNVIKSQANKLTNVKKTKIPGLIILQIDGLAYEVLRRAILNGDAPTINKWIRDGKYRLEKWETDWSSQTGASQTGILLGSNHNIPSFRWFQKSLGKVVTVGNPKDSRLIEKKLSNGKGLLYANGASRGNLFSGDAPDTLLTLSAIGNKNKKGFGHAYYAFFSNPYNLPRMIILFFLDVFRELKSRSEQTKRDLYPRLKKMKKSYPFLRASMTVGQRDILFQTLIGDIFEGKPVVYADFVGYDEVSHHTGPERHETLAVLRDIDRQIKRLENTFRDAPRPYKLVILSDHGQTQGETFKDRTGYSLEELIHRLIEDANIYTNDNKTEGSMYLDAAMVELTKSGGLVSKSIKLLKPQKKESNFNPNISNIEKQDIQVLASGNLGLIYFTKYKHRITYEEIEKNYPNLIENLIKHPYIGFLLVKSKKHGGIVIGPKGKIFLKTNKIIGENPLEKFSPKAIDHIKRTNTFDNCADIMVNSFYDPLLNEVAAFEELVGSHGGLGGNQSFPFLLFPKDLNYPSSHVVGASNVHLLLKKWLSDIGQKEYKNLHKVINKNKFE